MKISLSELVAYEKKTRVAKKPLVSITKNGLISFNEGFIDTFEIDRTRTNACKPYFHAKKQMMIFQFIDVPDKNGLIISKNRDKKLTFSIKSFILSLNKRFEKMVNHYEPFPVDVDGLDATFGIYVKKKLK
ncbi:MAG: hypothetical protein ACO3K7_04230 [Candidatus Marinamargulisbacteria bacterium]